MAAKEIKFGDSARSRMVEGINLLADADEVTHYANRLMSHGRKEIEAAKFALKAKGLK